MTVWFSSDQHLDHRNISRYSGRPYDDVDEMNEAIIANWNRVVEPGDLVYSLGDFCLGTPARATNFARRLHGNKYYIWGNHDKALRKHEPFISQWIWCRDLAEITVEAQKIVLCHFALRTWNQQHRGSVSLHGHSHGSLPDEPHLLSLDVGVDCWDLTPVSFETIKKVMSKKTWKPVDHHGRED